jgi:hypothetical protein
LVSKHPYFAQSWGPSEQPHRPDVNKKALRFASISEYYASVTSLLISLPIILTSLFVARPARTEKAPSATDFFGVALSPDAPGAEHLPDLISELGVKRLLLRLPVWQRERLAEYRQFIDKFPACNVTIAVLQDRGSICNLEQWRSDLRHIFTLFSDRVTYFQVPTASNRTKWGCIHMGDAMDLLEVAHALREEFPHVRLIGPGVIDFEPIPFLRGLINDRRYLLDVVGSLLYVDRRGCPTKRQYGFFDLRMKLRCWQAIMDASPRCRYRRRTPMWITEFNWPLKDTGEWSPTACDEQVDEHSAAEHLRDYCKIAYQSGMVERVYWWQLMHPGYGLIDNRDGQLRRRPTFFMAQRLLSGEESLTAPIGAASPA